MLSTVKSASQVGSYFVLSGLIRRYYQHPCCPEQVIEPGSTARGSTLGLRDEEAEPGRQHLCTTSHFLHFCQTQRAPCLHISRSMVMHHKSAGTDQNSLSERECSFQIVLTFDPNNSQWCNYTSTGAFHIVSWMSSALRFVQLSSPKS